MKRGWLTEAAGPSKGGPSYWVAQEVFEVIDARIACSSDTRGSSDAIFDQNTRR